MYVYCTCNQSMLDTAQYNTIQHHTVKWNRNGNGTLFDWFIHSFLLLYVPAGSGVLVVWMLLAGPSWSSILQSTVIICHVMAAGTTKKQRIESCRVLHARMDWEWEWECSSTFSFFERATWYGLLRSLSASLWSDWTDWTDFQLMRNNK